MRPPAPPEAEAEASSRARLAAAYRRDQATLAALLEFLERLDELEAALDEEYAAAEAAGRLR